MLDEDDVEKLSSKSSFFSNASLYFGILLSQALYLLLQLYKKLKFKKEIKYEQQLQQAVMTGVRNVYGPQIIFLGFLGFLGTLWFHFYFTEKNRQHHKMGEDNTFVVAVYQTMFLTGTISMLCFFPFLQNHKLR